MSPAVEQIRQTVESRIRELRPVISELEQLQAILSLIDTGGNSDRDELAELLSRAGLGAPTPQPLLRRGRRGTKPGRDGRAPQGANKRLIIETVLEHPGITAPEIAERTGIKRTIVSATVNRLKHSGELEPHGEGLRVPLVPTPDGPLAPALG
ncbi:MAG TPA: helix-turn-helix domain-containing protein [Solirubrobacterales bacterium]|nr:helix-turn-helix domain-containing protein [Solirubrobacterales bacterium]